MVAWMVYLTGIAAGLGLAGSLAEMGLRRLGRPARWAWVGSLVATIGLPLAFVLGGLYGGGSAAAGGRGGAWGGAWGRVWGAIPEGLGSAGVETSLVVGWITSSLMLLASVRLAAWTLRRNERAWRTEWADGHRESIRRMVVLHEAEHARAGDARLLMVGLMVVLLAPWCVPVWWQLRRLRAAIEVDCDQRVVGVGAPAPDYARALVAVAAGRGSGILPVPALAPPRGELDRRIRMLGVRPRRGSGRAGLALLVVAGALLLGLGIVPAPDAPGPGFHSGPAAVMEAAPSATLLLSVSPADDG